MKKKWVILIVLLCLTSLISSVCEEGHIDINTASLEELDQIKWVGVPTAEKIIALRPFDSLDDLIEISGISESRLGDIKSQGLACVEESEEKENSEIEEEPLEEEDKKEIDEVKEDEEVEKSEKVEEELENKPVEIIDLTPQNIKTEKNTEKLEKINYVKYGFVVFCALLGFLFILKKQKYKTEFC